MKKLNLISILLFLACLLSIENLNAKGDPEWKYDIQCEGTGADGSYLVKVWSYGKNAKISSEEIKQNAVNGVLFRGFPAGAQGCKGQKPIISSPAVYDEKRDFFDTFFGKKGEAGAAYSKYATIISPSPEVIKVNKKEYKVGVVVSVSKDLLRKDMEAAGIVKSLTSGF